MAEGSCDEWFESEFPKAMKEIDMDSSPGLCQFSVLGSTNADVFRYNEGKCDPDRVAMVKMAVWVRMQKLLDQSVTEWKESDDINVFVKPEPHKMKKMEEGRFRLISAVSLIDTMIDRILFGWLQRRALMVVGETPCLCGWSPMHGGWRYIYERYRGKATLCLDKSSWDWTVQPYLVSLWYEFVSELAVGASDWWRSLALARFDALFRSATFQFKDGTRVAQNSPGIMKSGCFLTLILNSVGQSMVHYLAMIRLGLNPLYRQPVCVGDDTVQVSFDGLEQYIREVDKTGAKVKGFKVRNWVEFCGFAFAAGTCTPAYWDKHLFKLQYADLRDCLVSYQMIYVNEPVMFGLLRELAAQVDPELVMSRPEAALVFNY